MGESALERDLFGEDGPQTDELDAMDEMDADAVVAEIAAQVEAHEDDIAQQFDATWKGVRRHVAQNDSR